MGEYHQKEEVRGIEAMLNKAEQSARQQVHGSLDPEMSEIDDTQAAIDEYNAQYEEEQTAMKKRAKTLLNSMATLYLTAEYIEENDYVKQLLEVEESSLSSLLYQLEVSKKAIHKLCEIIHTGDPHPRHFEVLTGLQRVSLDISKFQREHLAMIDLSLKGVREDAISMGRLKSPEVEALGEGNQKRVRTLDRRWLIKEIGGLGEEYKISSDRLARVRERNLGQDEAKNNIMSTMQSEDDSSYTIDHIEEI